MTQSMTSFIVYFRVNRRYLCTVMQRHKVINTSGKIIVFKLVNEEFAGVGLRNYA